MVRKISFDSFRKKEDKFWYGNSLEIRQIPLTKRHAKINCHIQDTWYAMFQIIVQRKELISKLRTKKSLT